MARSSWHRLFRSIFGCFNLRRNSLNRSHNHRIALEALESREVPAALTLSSSTLTYLETLGTANSLTVNYTPTNSTSGTITFTDSGEIITTSISGFTGSGTNSVSGTITNTLAKVLKIDLGTNTADTLAMTGSTNTAWNITPFSQSGGSITLASGGRIAGTSVTLTTPSLSLTATGGIGSYDSNTKLLSPLQTATTNLSAKNTGTGTTTGGIFLSNTGDVTLSGNGINNTTNDPASQLLFQNTGNVTINSNTAVVSSTGNITLIANRNGTSTTSIGSFNTTYSDPSPTTPVTALKSEQGSVILAANTVSFSTTAAQSIYGKNNVTLTTADPTRAIQLGTADSTKLAITNTMLGKVGAGKALRIGSNATLNADSIVPIPANTGGISILATNATDSIGLNTAVNWNNTLSLITGTTIAGTGGGIQVSNLAVRADGKAAASPYNSVNLTNANNKITQLAGDITANAGTVVINSTGSALTVPATAIDGILGFTNTSGYATTLDVTGSYNLTISSALKGKQFNLFANSSGVGTTGTIALNANMPEVDKIVLSALNTITLNGARTFNGTVEVTRGLFDLSGGNLTLQNGSVYSGDLVLSGTGKVDAKNRTVIIGNALNVQSGTSFTGNTGNVSAGSVTIGSGGTLTAPSAAGSFTVSSTWSNSGTFNHNNGTVTFTGASNTISGNNTFNNLVKSATSASEIKFKANSVQTIVGSLSLKGALGQLLDVKSDALSSPWSIDPQGTRDVQYVSVSDSQNKNATPILAANSLNAGKNTNWLFKNSPNSAVTLSLPAVTLGSMVTMTANLSGPSGTPTGTVSFQVGSVSMGTATLNSSGLATLTTSTLPAGTYSITANYSGDTNYAPGASNPTVLQVNGTQLTGQNQGNGSQWAAGFSGTNGQNSVQVYALAALGPNGSIVSWGSGGYGGTGEPTGTGYTQVFTNNSSFAALKADGSISVWGNTANGGGTNAPTGTGFTRISSSQSAFAALKADGSISAWGNTMYGGTNAPTGTGFTNIFASTQAFASLKSDGSISAWGSSTYGGAGAPTGSGFTNIIAGQYGFAAIKADGSITSWGSTAYGGIGAPTTSGFVQIYSNGRAYTAIRADGSLVSWGSSSYGGGLAPTGTGFTQVNASGYGAFAALKTDGSIATWGASGYGGSGGPTGTGYTAIFGAGYAMAALAADGSITVWGDSLGGGAGAPAGTGYTRIFSNQTDFVAMKADGTIRAWGKYSANGNAIPTGSGYTQVTFNQFAFAAMKADGTISSFGSASGGGGTDAPRTTGFTAFANQAVSMPAWQSNITGTLPTAYVGLAVAQPGANGVNAYQVGAYGLGMANAVTSGTLPSGLSLDAVTGFLTGTPTTAGTFSFTITSSNDAGTASRAFTLEVLTGGATVTPSAPADVFDTTLSNPIIGANGRALSANLAVAGNSGYKFEITLGSLPAGMTLNTATGVISGTPTATGTFQFTVAASSASGLITKGFLLRVDSPPVFTSSTTAYFVKDETTQFQLRCTGTPTITYTYAGTLPTGVSFNPATGSFSGIASDPAGTTYQITVTASNTAASTQQTLTMVVAGGVTITSASGTSFTQSTSGTFTVTATGTPTPTLTLLSGSLPGGISFDSATGILSGVTNAAAGDYPLQFRAVSTISGQTIGQAIQNFTLTVLSGLSFNSAASTTFTLGTPSTFTVAATATPTPTIALTSGTLPDGLSFDPNTGTFSGTPAAGTAGVYNLVFTATSGTANDIQNFTLNVAGAPSMAATASTTFTAGSSANSYQVVATGYPSPAFAVTAGTLPSGVSLSGSGVLSGTPDINTGGPYTFTITASNGTAPDANQSFTLSIDNPPVVSLFSPSHSRGGNTITISGQRFTGATLVTFAGGKTAVPTVVSDIEISVVVPLGAITGTVSVTRPFGTGTSLTNFVVDAVPAPQVTSISTDTGASTTDLITSDNNLTISGTAEALAVINVYSDTTFVGTTTANGSGNWTLSSTGILPDGTRALTATATDALGNISPVSTVYSVAVDANAPAAPSISATITTDTGISATDRITTDTDLRLTGTAEANASVAIYDGSTLLATVAADGTGAWVLASTGTLTHGIHFFTAKATDLAGNESIASASLAVDVDTSAPNPPALASAVGSSLVFTSGYAKDAILTISGTAEAGSTVELFEGAISLGTVSASAQGAWSFNTVALSEGSHAFTARATDLAGNISSLSSAITVIVDLTTPNSPLLTAPTLTNTLSPALSGTAEPNAQVAITFGGSTYTTTADNAGAWWFNLATNGLALQENANSIGLVATDQAGNASTSATGTVTVDTVAPGIIFNAVTGDDRLTKTELTGTITLSGTTEAGASVTIAIGTAAPVSVTPVGTAWSYTLTSSEKTAIGLLTSVNIVATATDTAGNISTKTRTVSLSNVVPPGTPVLLIADDSGLPDNITNKQTVRIVVGGLANVAVGNILRLIDGAGATLGETTVTASDVALGSYQFTVGPLDEGNYTITAVAIDPTTSDKGTSTGSLALTIDVRVPGAPSTPNLLVTHDTGLSNSDNVTNKNALLTFEIKLPDQVPFAKLGDTLRLYKVGETNPVTSLVLTSLTNPKTLTLGSTALPSGSHLFYSRLYIAATNSLGAASKNVEIVIDTVAPNAPSTPLLLAADDSGASNSDGITFAVNPQITYSLSGTNAVAGDRVEIMRGSSVLGSKVLSSANITADTVTIGLDSALLEGTNVLVARLTDIAGNSITSSSTTLTLDTKQPLAATIGLDAVSDTGSSTADKLTFDTTPTFSGTAEADSVVELFDTINNVVVGAAVVADSSGKWSITTPLLTAGNYTLVARSTDVAGNTAADSAQIQFTLDTTAPLAPSVDLPASEDTGVSNSDNITKTTVLNLTGSTDPFARVELFDGSTSLGSTTADSKGVWTFTTATLTAATYTFSATSTDPAGNVSLAGTVLTVIVDTAAPGTPSGITLADDTGSSNSDFITYDNTITIAGTTDANARVVIVDAQNRAVATTANGSGAFSLTTAALADGAQALVLTVTDVAGNTNTGTTINLTVDSNSPTPVLTSTSANLVNGVFSVTVTLPEDVTGFDNTDITLANGTLSNFVAVSPSVYTFDVTPTADGAVTVSVAAATAVDTAGNTSLASSTLTRTFDGTAPTVTTFTTAAPTPTNAPFTINVVFSEIVTGFVAADVTVTNGSVSNFTGQGTSYSFLVTPTADGATTVTLLQGVASDAAGNTSTASSTISRTYDGTGPTVVLSTSAAALTNAAFTVTATFSESVTGFGLNDLTVVNAATSGLTGSGTTYSFTVTPTVDGAVSMTVLAAAATDSATNASTASNTLSRVYDATAPDKPAISNTIATDTGSSSTDRITNDTDLQLTGTAEANASVAVYDGGTLLGTISADSSGNWTLTSTGTLSSGSHSFTAQATDAAGNTGNASLPLMVTIDTALPNAPSIDLLAADDFGSSDTDNITSKSVLRLTGLTEAFAGIEVFDGNTALGTTTADAAGNWLFTTSKLTGATYVFKAQATDIAGNISASKSSALSVVVDLTAPTDPGSVTPTTTSNPGDTLSGTAEANAKVILTIGGVPYFTTANGSGNWSLNLSGNGVSLVSGSNTIALQAVDVAGNSSAGSGTATVTFTAPNMQLAAGSDTGRSSSDGITSDTTPTLTGSTGVGYVVDLYEIIAGNRSYIASTTANGTGDWSVDVATALAEGNHSFVAEITPYSSGSPSGSIFDSDTVTIIVDITNPAQPSVGLMTDDDTGVSNSDYLTKNGTFRLVGQSEPYAFVELFDYTTSLGTVTADTAGNWVFIAGATTSLSEGTHLFSAKATDIAGNDPPGGPLTVVVDVTAPSAPTGVAIADDTGSSASDFITSDDTLDISGTTEPGALVLLTDDLNRSVSTTADATTGAFTLSNATLADGVHSLKLIITDTAGNANVGSTYNVTVDTVKPTVQLSTSAADPTNQNPFIVTATFAESITGLTLGDIIVTNGTANTLIGSGSTYTFNVVPTADGKIEVSIGANAANDIAGNSSLASNTLVRVYDGTAPTVVLTTPATAATKAPFTVTATFSEDVTGLVVSDITATNGATVGSFTAVSAKVYTFVVTPTSQGQVDVSIATGMAIDVASNDNVASATLSRIYDTVAPGVSLASTAADPTNGSFTVTATFTEPVFGFDLGDLILNNATASTLAGSGATYTFVVTAITDGTVTINVTGSGTLDSASNANTPSSTSLTRVIDTVLPQAAISSTSGSFVNSPFTVDIDFSEPVSGLTVSDFTVAGGSASNLTGSGKTYQLSINPSSIPVGQQSSIVSVMLPANSVSDAAGNPNTASSTITRTFDDILPVPTIAVDVYDPLAGVYPAKVTFSEPVTGFDLTDLTLSNLTASNLSGSGSTYYFDLVLSAATGNTITIAANAASDYANNSSVASGTTSIVSDIEPPTAELSANPYLNIANSASFIVTVVLTDLPVSAGDPVSGLSSSSFPATLNTNFVGINAVLNPGSYDNTLGKIGAAITKASATYTLTSTTANGWLDFQGATVLVDISNTAFKDVAGNSGQYMADTSFQVDVVAPVISKATRTTLVANSEEFRNVDLLFSEPVTGVDYTGLALQRTTKAGGSTIPLSGSSINMYQLSSAPAYRLTGITQSLTSPGGDYAFIIPAGTTIMDVAGNPAVTGNSPPSWTQIDFGARPIISSTLPSLTNNPVLPITATFGRAMKNLTSAGIIVLDGNNQNISGMVTISPITRSVDGKKFSFTITLGTHAPLGTVRNFTIKLADAAAVTDDAQELPSGFSSARAFTIDQIPPSAQLVPWPSQFVDGGKANLSTLDYKAIFDQPVQNLPRNFIIMNAGSGVVTSVFAIAGTNQKEWRVTVKPRLVGNTVQRVTARLATGIVSDLAGNSNNPSNTVVVDIKRNLAITSTLNPGVNTTSFKTYNYSVGKLNDISVRFPDSVDPSTITAASFNVTGGTVANIRPDIDNKGAKFDLIFANRPYTKFVLSVAVKAGGVRDTFGNTVLASTPLAWTIDGQSQLATMSGAARIRLGETATVVIKFTEAVQPLISSMFDVSFTPFGSTSSITVPSSALLVRGTGSSYTISYKPTLRGTLTVRLKIDDGGPKDLVGNVLQVPMGYQVMIV